MNEAELREYTLEMFSAIVNVTSPIMANRNPNRSRALAGQIARSAIQELRKPREVKSKP